MVMVIGRTRSRAALADRVTRPELPAAFGLQGEIDHHDGVLHHHADQHDAGDRGHQSELNLRRP
jgi:hypothetical protein